MLTAEQALDQAKVLLDEGYKHVSVHADGTWRGLLTFNYTVAIVCGSVANANGYEDRWCYHTPVAALLALNVWKDDEPEPVGWHRHPKSGRRIDHNDWQYDDEGNQIPPGTVYVAH